MFWTSLLVVLLIVIYETESSSFCKASPSDPSELLLTYHDHVLGPPHTFISNSVCAESECKTQCRIDSKCLTVSVIKQGGYVECRKSQKSIPDLYLTPSVGGVTYAKNESKYFLGDGGFFYHVIASSHKLAEGKENCSKISPQWKVIMPKTKSQTKSILDYRKILNYAKNNDYFMVDMHWDTSRNAIVWGDGTLYTDSEVGQIQPGLTGKGSIYTLTTNNSLQYFKLYETASTSFIICQMNPLRAPA